MTRNWETLFSNWAKPPSQNEQDRCDRVIRAIKKAVADSPELNNREILVFTQGSYRNNVNVRQESDVDVGVMLYQYFLAQYPEGKGRGDFEHVDAGYGFAQFKNELENALVAYFGRTVVTRGNKAFDVKAHHAQVEADVVPFFEFRDYSATGSYRGGVALIPDNGGGRVENFPEHLVSYWPNKELHYENGVSKNLLTHYRFKSVVRILKKLRVEMEGMGIESARVIPGYLIECLTWNAKDWCFEHPTWDARVQSVLAYLWQNLKDPASCESWSEVDAIKYLFHDSQPWTREQAFSFIDAAWNHVGVRPA